VAHHRASARAQQILADLPQHEPAPVARDKPQSGE